MKQKSFALITLGVVSVAVAGMFTVAKLQNNYEPSFQMASAIDPNPSTVEFGLRREAGVTFASEPSQGVGGWNLNVTAADFAAWKLSLTNWSFPVVDGKDYYCEFVMTASVSGSEGDQLVGGVKGNPNSEVILVCNENLDGGREQKNFFKKFTADREFVVGQTFTGSGTSSKIHLQLGALRTTEEPANQNFTVSIRKFVLKENDAGGNILTRINFESGEAFADRWKAANGTVGFFCTKANVEEYIYDYYSLYESERAIVDNTDDVSGDRKIGATVQYLVNHHGM